MSLCPTEASLIHFHIKERERDEKGNTFMTHMRPFIQPNWSCLSLCERRQQRQRLLDLFHLGVSSEKKTDDLKTFVKLVLTRPHNLVINTRCSSDIHNRLGDVIFVLNHNFEVIIDIITEIIQNWSAIYPV